jgi:membrane-bound metal-dependent hydrolase YbcI (DUF457 family)
MKGISHFTSAVAAAAFIPGVVSLAAQEHSLILLLAGFFGLLPDWLDFKFARYFEPAEEVIEPDALNFNAPTLAEQVADALNRAHTREEPLTLQLHSARIGPDRWRRYSIQFDPTEKAVIVRPGSVIDGGGLTRTEAGSAGPTGQAPVTAKLNYTYDGEMSVETLDGPSFEFRRAGDAVEISFLPWHRRWSHSLVLAAGFGFACGALFGPLAGWVAAAAFATHVLEDQLGYLGSNLWWPFTERRSHGLRLMHSGDALPNFVTVLTACGLILYNLNRFATPSLYNGNVFLLWAVLLPAATGLAFYYRQRRPLAAPEAEILSELEETEAE